MHPGHGDDPGVLMWASRITAEEYRELFEGKWRGRARAVGYDVRFEYDGSDTTMILDATEAA